MIETVAICIVAACVAVSLVVIVWTVNVGLRKRERDG